MPAFHFEICSLAVVTICNETQFEAELDLFQVNMISLVRLSLLSYFILLHLSLLPLCYK